MLQLTVGQLRWILLGIGLLVIGLIYFMGIRSARHRSAPPHNRQSQEPTVNGRHTSVDVDDIDIIDTEPSTQVATEVPEHLAGERLVDVQVTPIKRDSLASHHDGNKNHDKQIPAPAPATPLDASVLEPPVDTPITTTATQPTVRMDDPVAMPVVAPAVPKTPKPPEKAPEMVVLLNVLIQREQRINGIQILEAMHALELKYAKSGVFDCFIEGIDEGPLFSIANVVEPGIFPPDKMLELTTPGLMMYMQLPGPMDNVESLDMMIAIADELARMLDGVLCDDKRKPLGSEGLAHLRMRVARFDTRHQIWLQSQDT